MILNEAIASQTSDPVVPHTTYGIWRKVRPGFLHNFLHTHTFSIGFILGVGGHVFDIGLPLEPILNHTENGEHRGGPVGTGLFHHHEAESYGWHHYML